MHRNGLRRAGRRNAVDLLASLLLLLTVASGGCAWLRPKASPPRGGAGSEQPCISLDGRFVAFTSDAPDLVPGDTNAASDVFVRDRETDTTSRASVATGGGEVNGESWGASLSGDGRFVAFTSRARNLVVGDTNGQPDIFVHDRQTLETVRVSVSSSGVQGNGASDRPVISKDGSVVAFETLATSLVPEDTNDDADVLVHDLRDHQTTRASVGSNGSQANAWSGDPALSADGRFVAFDSSAWNLVPGDADAPDSAWHVEVYLHDRSNGSTRGVSMSSETLRSEGRSGYAQMANDPMLLVLHSTVRTLAPGDTNGTWDVLLVDLRSGGVQLISRSPQGIQGSGQSSEPAISANGNVIAFLSSSPELASGDGNGAFDVLLYDRATGEIRRASISSDGEQANADSAGPPALSADGRLVAFESAASNLVPDDDNGTSDVFLHDRVTGEIELISIPLREDESDDWVFW